MPFVPTGYTLPPAPPSYVGPDQSNHLAPVSGGGGAPVELVPRFRRVPRPAEPLPPGYDPYYGTSYQGYQIPPTMPGGAPVYDRAVGTPTPIWSGANVWLQPVPSYPPPPLRDPAAAGRA